VLIALPAKSIYERIQAAIGTCERAGVEAKYLADVFEVSLAKPFFEGNEDYGAGYFRAVDVGDPADEPWPGAVCAGAVRAAQTPVPHI
jgi:hypothetical protein